MDNEDFQKELTKAYMRNKKVLNAKEKEYSEGIDRFDQFKKAAVLNEEPATKSLWGMAVKHVTSIATMSKNPTMYSSDIWKEKLVDLRNYLFLLEVLLVDLGDIENE